MSEQKQARSMAAFMKGQAKQLKELEAVVSHRFVDEDGEPVKFVFKGIGTKRIEMLQDDCTFTKKGVRELDSKLFMAKLGIETTVYPNFKDKELLESYGVHSATDVVKEVLSIPGEYAEWVAQVQKANGFDEDFNELVEDAKN